MNKEQQELVNEAYENYESRQINMYIPIWSQEKFINKCKTDQEFSEKWELTIEERELSYEERKKLCKLSDRVYPNNEWMKENNIPRPNN
jgi:hypothetical protein